MPASSTTDCILVRHAHAEWPGWRGRDFDRPLTARGIEDARASGRALRAAGIAPRFMIASAALRTMQTARMMAEELNLPAGALGFHDSLYNADALSLQTALLEAIAAGGPVVLVAHNPGISELARLLSGDTALAPFRPADWRCVAVSSAGDTARRS